MIVNGCRIPPGACKTRLVSVFREPAGTHFWLDQQQRTIRGRPLVTMILTTMITTH